MAWLSLDLLSPLQFGLLLVAFLAAAWALQPTQAPYNAFPRVHRPVMPWPWAKSVEQSLQEGYDKYSKPSGSPFVMRWWAKDYLVLPPKYLPDLRTAPGSHVSFFQNLSDALYLPASAGDLYDQPERMIEVIKTGLNANLTKLTPLICEQADTALAAEIGKFNGWREMTAASLIFAVTHRISCRFLINEDLSRQEDFVAKSTAFVQSLFVNAFIIKLLPLALLRDWLPYPLSFLHRRKMEAAIRVVQPEVERRLAERDARGGSTDLSKLDALEWTLSTTPPNPAHNDPRHISIELLHNLWAAAGSPGVTTAMMLYQVLMEPRYLEPLRSEALRSTTEYGWTEKAIQNLPLQDSFIRELSRSSPPFTIACARTIKHEPWRLSDGLTLPVGTRCIWPGKAITTDPDKFENANKFDGFRFARLAQETHQSGEAANKYAAGYVSTTNLGFGFGNHACPGRFYALREVKVMFSKLILEYDIKWAAPQIARPPDVDIEGQHAPNLSAKICLKKR